MDLSPHRMSIHEMLVLMTCAHGAENRMIQDIIQHSPETVRRHFHSVLKVVFKLAVLELISQVMNNIRFSLK